MAVASLVLGILSLALPAGGLSLPAGVAGMILGILARRKAGGRGMAMAGIVLSAVGLGVGLVHLGVEQLLRPGIPPRGITV